MGKGNVSNIEMNEARARAAVMQAVSRLPKVRVTDLLRRIADEIDQGIQGPDDHPRAKDGRKYPVRIYAAGERREKILAVVRANPEGALSSEIMEAFPDAQGNREERGRIYSVLHDLKARFTILTQDPETKRYKINENPSPQPRKKDPIPREGRTVGIYHITRDPQVHGRFILKNTFMGFSHTTYGTPEEVIEKARRQSDVWNEKKNSPKPPIPYPSAGARA